MPIQLEFNDVINEGKTVILDSATAIGRIPNIEEIIKGNYRQYLSKK